MNSWFILSKLIGPVRELTLAYVLVTWLFYVFRRHKRCWSAGRL